MKMEIIKQLNDYLDILLKMQSSQESSLKALGEFSDKILIPCKHKGGSVYYYSKDRGSGPRKYIGKKDAAEVDLIRNAHFLDASLDNLKSNIELLRTTIQNFRDIDYEGINASLPLAYQGSPLLAEPSRDERAVQWKKKKEAFKAEPIPEEPNDKDLFFKK